MENFDSELFSDLINTGLVYGISTGFVLAFIAWAIGYAIYALIKWFKMT